MFHHRELVAGALLALLLALASAQAAPVIQVSPGFRRLSRPDAPMPVAVVLSGDTSDRRLEIEVAGTPAARFPLDLGRGTTKQVFLYTEPETSAVSGGFPLLTVREGNTILHRERLETTIITPERLAPVVGGPGFSASGVELPALEPQELPERARGYSSLAAIMIYPAAWARISERSLEALACWVEGGGTVIAPLVARSERLRLGGEHPFGPVMPGQDLEVRGLCRALEDFVDGTPKGARKRQRALEEYDRVVLAGMPAGVTRDLRLDVEAAGTGKAGEEAGGLLAGQAVIGRRRHGSGTVILLAFDPLAVGLSGWKRRAEILGALLSSKEDLGALGAPLARQPAPLENVARRLVIPHGSKQPAVGWFVLFLFLYILLLIPGDYLLVKWLKRPRLNWVTFPLLVLVFCGVAWDMGRGRLGALEYREVTIIDCLRPDGAGLARSYIGIYSDTNSALRLRPLPRRAELELLDRGSGGERTYFQGGKEEDLVQKMHIWAYHGYRATWRVAGGIGGSGGIGGIISAVLNEEDGPARVEVAHDLPRAPAVGLVVWKGRPHRLSLEEMKPGERHQAELGAEMTWEEFCGELGSELKLAAADAHMPLREIRSSLEEEARQGPFLLLALPRPWPAVEVVTRRPRETWGFCLVRVPLALSAGEEGK